MANLGSNHRVLSNNQIVPVVMSLPLKKSINRTNKYEWINKQEAKKYKDSTVILRQETTLSISIATVRMAVRTALCKKKIAKIVKLISHIQHATLGSFCVFFSTVYAFKWTCWDTSSFLWKLAQSPQCQNLRLSALLKSWLLAEFLNCTLAFCKLSKILCNYLPK